MHPTNPDTHPRLLEEIIAMGMDFARVIHEDAMAASTPSPAQVAAFDRVTRGVRRTVLLVRKLAEAPTPSTRRTQARARIVEDAIRREHGNTPRAETLRAELVERLDAPDLARALDAEIAFRPLPEIIANILDDLHLAVPPGAQPRPRRTPADLRTLLRQAAAPPTFGPRQADLPTCPAHHENVPDP